MAEQQVTVPHQPAGIKLHLMCQLTPGLRPFGPYPDAVRPVLWLPLFLLGSLPPGLTASQWVLHPHLPEPRAGLVTPTCDCFAGSAWAQWPSPGLALGESGMRLPERGPSRASTVNNAGLSQCGVWRSLRPPCGHTPAANILPIPTNENGKQEFHSLSLIRKSKQQGVMALVFREPG